VRACIPARADYALGNRPGEVPWVTFFWALWCQDAPFLFSTVTTSKPDESLAIPDHLIMDVMRSLKLAHQCGRRNRENRR